jgi:hypothetical protein
MSDATRIANLEGSLADVAAYLDELRSALASHDAVLGSQRLTELEQKISPSLAAPGVPPAPGSVTGDSALAGLGSAYSTSVAMGAAGLFVTDGAITVTNGSSVVIIDGTSDMFKIVGTGTMTQAMPNGTYAWSSNTSTITSLGAYSVLPVVTWMAGVGEATGYRAQGSYIVRDVATGGLRYGVITHAQLSVDSILTITITAENGSYNDYGATAYARFHILKEEGI